MKTNRFLVAACVSLALALFFSCSSDGDDDTSSPASSGSGGEIFSTVCDIQGYRTVEIDGQNWMAENLDCNIKGSKCYDNNSANCEKYGRMYNWATAMALPSSCNFNSCASQVQSQHRGICPEGWHIPNFGDWAALVFAAGGETDSGTKLKARNGWSNKITHINCDDNDESYCNYIAGTDNYGFSALPGGIGAPGFFRYIGEMGWWWTAGEYAGDGFGGYKSAVDAGYVSMSNSGSSMDNSVDEKILLISVRCLQDYEELPVGSGCDIQNYRTVKIGEQTWMAENLNCNVNGSKCLGSCKKYGRLYNWATAMSLPPSCNSDECEGQIQSPHRGICPEGWHIPSSEEWDILVATAGGEENLKAKSGWNSNGNGTDDYGFSALPSGRATETGFGGMGDIGLWWSSTEQSATDAKVKFIHRNNTGGVMYSWFSKPDMFAVRCLKDL